VHQKSKESKMGVQQDFDPDLATDFELAESQAENFHSVYTGCLVGFQQGSVPLVMFPQSPISAAIPARTIVELFADHIGEDVVLQFEQGDPTRPIIMGVVRQPSAWPLRDKPEPVTVVADDQRLVLDAKQQIVLRCGKASITLTREGKVLIRGTYISSRSSGANRIKGGSVLLN